MDFDYYMSIARKSLRKFRVGKTFASKNLFDVDVWNALSQGEKIMFGTHFSNAVKQGKVDAVRCFNEKSHSQPRYIYKR